MNVALTYDHRLVDGREAVTFLKTIKDAGEDPRRLLREVWWGPVGGGWRLETSDAAEEESTAGALGGSEEHGGSSAKSAESPGATSLRRRHINIKSQTIHNVWTWMWFLEAAASQARCGSFRIVSHGCVFC